MAVDPASHRVYASNRGTGTVSIIDGMRVIGVAKVGQAPGGMAADDMGRVYVSNAGSNTVSIVEDRMAPDAASALAESTPAHSPLIGRQLPPFRLRDENGKEHTLDEYRGKILMLNFFSTW